MTLLAIFIFLICADARITWLGLRNRTVREINPVVRWLISRLGVTQMMVLKTVLLLGLGIFGAAKNELSLQILTAFYAAVVVWNYYQFTKK